MTLAARLPAGRPGQLLAVAITLGLALLVWEAAASPLLAFYEDRATTVADARLREAHMRAVAASLPALRDAARRAVIAGPAASSLLTGNTDAVAAAALQGRIQDMAGTAGTTLSSTEALSARQQGAYRRIALRISLNAPLPVLVRLLQSIDESTPRMLVDDLQLHTSPMLVAQAHSGSPPLDASMTVIGFRLGQGGDDAGDAAGGGAP